MECWYCKISPQSDFNYENVSPPHPAIAENTRGEKSLAGLMGVPQLYPYDRLNTPTLMNPIKSGIKP